MSWVWGAWEKAGLFLHALGSRMWIKVSEKCNNLISVIMVLCTCTLSAFAMMETGQSNLSCLSPIEFIKQHDLKQSRKLGLFNVLGWHSHLLTLLWRGVRSNRSWGEQQGWRLHRSHLCQYLHPCVSNSDQRLFSHNLRGTVIGRVRHWPGQQPFLGSLGWSASIISSFSAFSISMAVKGVTMWWSRDICRMDFVMFLFKAAVGAAFLGGSRSRTPG